MFRSGFGGKSPQRDTATAHVLLPTGVNAFVYNPPFVELQAHTGGLRYFNRFPGRTFTLTEIYNSVGEDTPPVGADIIVDVLINGVSIFSDPANRPRILDGETTGLAIPDATDYDTTAFAFGDWLTVDIIQVGSSDPGSDLTVQIAVI